MLCPALFSLSVLGLFAGDKVMCVWVHEETALLCPGMNTQPFWRLLLFLPMLLLLQYSVPEDRKE
jgi:hypothetical protein